MIKNKFLFNFSASFSGGGFKRLYAFAKWFHENGGAFFIIHVNCVALLKEFSNNHFTVIKQSKVQRIFNDCGYLKEIQEKIGVLELYYSYGIPIYNKVAQVNWFHLSNVLPLSYKGFSTSTIDKLRLNCLGRRIDANFNQADIISAESNFSLGLINQKHAVKFFVSVNGSDDEIFFDHNLVVDCKDHIAVVVGTFRHKALEDSYSIFKMLREKNNRLQLVIIGSDEKVPRSFRVDKNIRLTGCLQRSEVVSYLSKAEYYISTTRIENSYNAASEGIFFANESFISDIEPHRELLNGMSVNKIFVPDVKNSVLHIKKDVISKVNLKTWDNVITEMINYKEYYEQTRSDSEN